MPDLGSLLKVAHALVGAWFMAGLIGRGVTLGLAARSRDLAAIGTLLKASDIFERRMVIPGSMVVLVLGIATAIAQGRPLLGPLQGQGVDWLFVSLILFIALLPLVPLVFLPRGRVFDAALEEARAQGGVTDALVRAFADPAVAFARRAELLVIGIIFVLMIAKPF